MSEDRIAAPGDTEGQGEVAGLDPGIREAVEVLRRAGIETFESCQGGPGHAMPEPTVRFHGERNEGFRALTAALDAGLPVAVLNREWPVLDGEPTGPYWSMTFAETLR